MHDAPAMEGWWRGRMGGACFWGLSALRPVPVAGEPVGAEAPAATPLVDACARVCADPEGAPEEEEGPASPS